MNVVAIIQARMYASRFPGKVMEEISGNPLLYHVCNRVNASKLINNTVIATTIEPEDATIVDFAKSINTTVYRGSAEDVLDRYYNAAKSVNADIIVRVTADDPFVDPAIIDKNVSYLLLHYELDYVSNTLKHTYPEGLGVEVFKFTALKTAHENAKLLSEREHVTPYIWKNTHTFKLENIENEEDLSQYRLTVDYPNDLALARIIYSNLYKNNIFLMDEIITFLKDNPHLLSINNDIQRYEGYYKSLSDDMEVL